MNLLIYFALPIATIILAVVLEKIIRCPYLTAAAFFAIYLIVAFAAFDASFLIFVIVYTILAFIAAFIAEYFFSREDKHKCRRRECECRSNSDYQIISSNGNIIYEPDDIRTNAINTERINTNRINADRINTSRINTNRINTNTIDTNVINTNSINTNGNLCDCNCNCNCNNNSSCNNNDVAQVNIADRFGRSQTSWCCYRKN